MPNYIVRDSDNLVSGVADTLASGDTLYIAPNVLEGSETAADGVQSAGGATVQDYGAIFGYDGIQTFGISVTVTVGEGGSIDGFVRAGIFSSAVARGGQTLLTLQNGGDISGKTAGIWIAAGGNEIDNSGQIYGGKGPAIKIESDSGQSTNYIDNSGLITASQANTAINAGDAPMVLTNSGHIKGNILFGASDDIYNGTLGSDTGTIFGRGGADVLKAGADGDILNGGGASDRISGGSGEDTFAYTAISDSTGALRDKIVGFDAAADTFQLTVTPSVIDTEITTGLLKGGANFDPTMEAAIGAGQLGANHAVLFTPNAGNLAGFMFLIVDANGTAGYQAGQDYVMELLHPLHLSDLSTDNFA